MSICWLRLPQTQGQILALGWTISGALTLYAGIQKQGILAVYVILTLAFCLSNWKPQFYFASLLVVLISVCKALPWVPVCFLKPSKVGGTDLVLVGSLTSVQSYAQTPSQ